jgi:DNA-binding beta-propeller fold protein YncE
MTVSVRRRPLQYSHTIGALALTGRGFSNPVDLALGENGMMYVINRSNSFQAPQGAVRVTICTIDQDYVGQFGGFGTDDGGFVWPTSIARDSKGNLFVSDEHRHDVQMFDAQGNFVRRWGSFGSEEGQLNRPSGLAIDPDDNVLVVDHLNHRIQRFSPEGQRLGGWGSQGSEAGQFDMPWGVVTDASGNVYVADWRNDRIQKFSPDGQHLASVGRSGSGDGELRRPANLGVDRDGTIYVADWGNERVVVFTPEGYPLTTLVGDSEMSKWGAEFLSANQDLLEGRKVMADGTPEKRFWGPTAIEIDEQGHVLIVDSCRHRIQVYEHV